MIRKRILMKLRIPFFEPSMNMPFSCFGKKRAKRSRLKGRYEQMRPLKYPQPHRHPAFKNVPIFERLHSANL